MVGMAWQRLAALTAVASMVGIAACGGGGDGAADSSLTSTGDVARADSAATAPAPAGSPASGGALAITGGDPEVVQVMAVVDQGEVEDGRLAQRQGRNAQVKAFGRELVASHTKSLQRVRQLARTANVELMSDSAMKSASPATGTDTNRAATGATTPQGQSPMGGPNSVAGQLHTMHMQMMERVRGLQGANFDSAFVNAQVMGHQQVLDLFQRAQGQAQNPDVQSHLTQATQEVQKHLESARELQQTLQNASTGATAGDSASKSKTRADTGRRG